MFDNESNLLLPGQSGIASVVSSNTSTNPGSSPRGVTSAPRSLEVPRQTKGERAMKFRQCLSNLTCVFNRARSTTGGYAFRNSVSSATRPRSSITPPSAVKDNRDCPRTHLCLHKDRYGNENDSTIGS